MGDSSAWLYRLASYTTTTGWRHLLDVRIGIIQSPREITFETEQTAEEVAGAIVDAAKQDTDFVTFTDVKGTTYLINVDEVAYVEVGPESARRVGFVS